MRMRAAISSLLVLAALAGCMPTIKMDQAEVKKRKLLVMVYGKPTGYVWSMAGTMGAAVGFGLIGLSGQMVAANERGNEIEKALGDLDIPGTLSREAAAASQEAGAVEVVRICAEGETPAGETLDAAGCAEKPADLAALKAAYPGQLMLVLNPFEMGVRDQKPYLAVLGGLLDIDSGKWVWQEAFGLNNPEIEGKGQSWRDWVKDPAALRACLEQQITAIAKQSSCRCLNGPGEKKQPLMTYMGTVTLDAKTVMSPGKPTP